MKAKVRRPEKILLVMTPGNESLGPWGLANSVASKNQDLVREQEEVPWVQIMPRSRFNPKCQEELQL